MEEKSLALSSQELEIKQAESLSVLATSLQSISQFLTNGGLQTLLNGYAKSQAVKEILGGLAQHSGRQGLDARVLTQNAVEIVEQVEKVFEKYAERLAEKGRDPEIKDSEADFKKWQSST